MEDETSTGLSESDDVDEENASQNSEIFLEKMKKFLANQTLIPVVRTPNSYQAKHLIEKLKSELFCDYDTSFLSDYLKVLESNNSETIGTVTDKIIYSIEEALRQQRYSTKPLGEWQGVMLGVWLSAAIIWNDPIVSDAQRTYHALLEYIDNNQMMRIARAWRNAAPVEALITLSDVSRAPPASSRLAQLLLRAALHRLFRDTPPQWSAELTSNEVATYVSMVTDERTCLLLTRIASRVLADKPCANLVAALASLRDTKAGSSLKVSISVAKLQLLFGDSKRRHEDRIKRGPSSSKARRK